MEWFFFALFGLAALVGSLGVVLSRNAVHSALFLLLNFAASALLFLLLGAQFLAMAQILVYAGAIVVLFIFVVMLIGNETMDDFVARERPALRLAALALVVLFLAGGVYAVFFAGWPAASGLADYGAVESVGRLLFTRYLLPFELASVILLAAMIGAIILAGRTRPPLGRPEE